MDATVDRLGVEVSEPNRLATCAQWEAWFGRSVVADADGRPLRVYRGEHGDVVGQVRVQTRHPSVTFVASAEVASLYAASPNDRVRDASARAPRVLSAYLSMQRPVFTKLDDPFVDFDEVVQVVGHERGLALAIQCEAHIEHTGNWQENFRGKFESVADVAKRAPARLSELYWEAHAVLDDPQFVAAAAAAGFDGAIYLGTGASSLDLEYRVFDARQVAYALEVEALLRRIYGEPVEPAEGPRMRCT